MANFSKPKVILLDMEGTVCDKHFFAKTLFPFVKSNINKFLVETYEEPETKELIGRLREAQKSNKKMSSAPPVVSGNKDMVCRSGAQCFEWLMSKNLNTSEVKQLVLLCWLWAYTKGSIQSQVFDDVPKVLHIWKNNLSLKLYTFSSGLTAAQKLMLCQTNRGNIHCLIDGYFDNSIGDKKDAKSYAAIQKTVGVDAKDILFVSDSGREVRAAKSVGYKVCLIRRPGARGSDVGDVPVVNTFADIKF